MATQTILEKMTGSVDSMTQPVYVYDDGESALSQSAAVAAAQAAAPASIFTVVQDANPGVEMLADFAWRITIVYRTYTPRTLSRQALGETRYNMNLSAKPKKDLRFAKEIGKFPANAPSMGGVITVSRAGNSVQPMGLTVQPPAPNIEASLVVASSTFTVTYVRNVWKIMGRYNSVAMGFYAIGEVFLSRFSSQLLDDDSILIKAGWSVEPNVTGETRGDVTGINYRGHDYVWEAHRPFVDRNGSTLALVAKHVYVNDIWGGADLRLLGITPP